MCFILSNSFQFNEATIKQIFSFVKEQDAPGAAISAELVTEKQLCRPSGTTATEVFFC